MLKLIFWFPLVPPLHHPAHFPPHSPKRPPSPDPIPARTAETAELSPADRGEGGGGAGGGGGTVTNRSVSYSNGGTTEPRRRGYRRWRY